MRKRKEASRAENRRRRSLTAQVEQRELSTEKSVEDSGPDVSNVLPEQLIPSGSTMLNCACSGNPFGAFAFGSINTIPGKPAAGKTILALSILTECAVDKRFDDHLLLYDDAEQSLGFDLNKLFLPLVAGAPTSSIGHPDHRLTFPNIDDEDDRHQPVSSETIQDFKSSVLNLCQQGKPFIYILDTPDALTTDEELEKEFKAAIAAAKSNDTVKELKGSYKAEKAKHLGEALRMINGYIRQSNSALFILQQVRQKFNAMKFAQQWTTSCGNAPEFYSFHRLYLSKASAIKDTAKNMKFKIGGRCKVEVMKNKITGHICSAEFDIYADYGIDDINSCIDFLIKTKRWKADSGGVTTGDLFDGKIKRSDLVHEIETQGVQKNIQEIVGQVWTEIENELKLDRQKRY